LARSLLIISLVLAVAAISVTPARADGDPASDYLISQDVFVPFDARIPAKDGLRLASMLSDAKAAGYPLRVAIIATPYDLGTAAALYRAPQQYARFLGLELSFVYKDRLLIVMPNGYGIYRHRKSVAHEQRALAGLPAPNGTGGSQLFLSAATAIQRLAATEGVRLTLPTADRGGSMWRWIALGAVVVGVLATAAGVLVLRRVLRVTATSEPQA
jgi:hypothetical protein